MINFRLEFSNTISKCGDAFALAVLVLVILSVTCLCTEKTESSLYACLFIINWLPKMQI